MKEYVLSVTVVGEKESNILQLTTTDLAMSMEQYQRNRPLLKWQVLSYSESIQEDPSQLKIEFPDGI